MYPFIVLLMVAALIAAAGLFHLVDGLRRKNSEKMLRSSYWLSAAAATAFVGLIFLVII
jgi:hypothetical protein